MPPAPTPETAASFDRRAGCRVVHLTSGHRPFDVRIFEKECVALAAAGYEVHLLAPGAPDGERHSGVRMHELGAAGGHGNPAARWRSRVRQATQRAAALNASIYHVHEPEMIPVGMALKRRGAKVVYDAHEDAPMEAWSMNAERLSRRLTLPPLWSGLLALARARFDAFVAATPRIAQTLPAGRTIEVRNYPKHELFADPRHRTPRPAHIASRLIFPGLATAARGADAMLDLIAAIDPALGVRLTLMGELSPPATAQRLKQHPGWSRVDSSGYQPWADVLAAYRSSLCGLLLYRPTPEQQWAMPVKLYEYLLSGLPVIATDMPFWRQELDGNPGVFFVAAGDTAAAAAHVERLARSPGCADALGRTAAMHARQRFDWTPQAARLVDLYDRLLLGGTA